MSKIRTLSQSYNEKKSNKKRYIQYPTAIKISNGNVVIIDKVEYYRKTRKLILYYIDDTEELLHIVDLLRKYYQYMEIYKSTQNQSALVQASSILLKLNELVPSFDIVQLETHRQTIIDEYKDENDLERLHLQTQLDPILIKAILVLEDKIKIKVE